MGSSPVSSSSTVPCAAGAPAAGPVPCRGCSATGRLACLSRSCAQVQTCRPFPSVARGVVAVYVLILRRYMLEYLGLRAMTSVTYFVPLANVAKYLHMSDVDSGLVV